MGFFSNQFSNVVEWEEYRDDLIFWKWKNREIKKGSKLIIRPGQDAIFMFNGAVEGIFEDDGSYDIESQIIPFLSTLKGFKFGFNSGMRAEVLFVNTKEFMFNKNNALSNIITSYAEGNLDKFNLDYENGEKFLIIVTRDDCDVCVKQIIALKNSLVNKKVNVHYINVDKLLKNDEYKINSIVDNKINNSDIYFVVIDDKQVIYKTCKYLNEEEIDKLLNEYDLIKNN